MHYVKRNRKLINKGKGTSNKMDGYRPISATEGTPSPRSRLRDEESGTGQRSHEAREPGHHDISTQTRRRSRRSSTVSTSGNT